MLSPVLHLTSIPFYSLFLSPFGKQLLTFYVSRLTVSLPFLLFPQGDSGGPLLCAGVALGIVSYGLSNAKPPAIFTRISPYWPWIDEVLKEN